VADAAHAAGDAAGLNGAGREPVGLHDLRHSFVALALALEAGVSLAEAARSPVTRTRGSLLRFMRESRQRDGRERLPGSSRRDSEVEVSPDLTFLGSEW
jgi:integrase